MIATGMASSRMLEFFALVLVLRDRYREWLLMKMWRNLSAFMLIAVLAAPAAAQTETDNEPMGKTVLGVRNVPLKDGADAMLAGNWENGVRLTHMGLDQAHGTREVEAALSNLCAGYLQLGKYEQALYYCDTLIERNPENWRGYNNRALVYIKTKEWDKAEADLERGEALNGGAVTMKRARAMYMDALYPVSPEIEIDDREEGEDDPEETDDADTAGSD